MNISKKNINDLKYALNQKPDAKAPAHLQGEWESMPIIRCVCGAEILVVPDLKAMNQAIENHVAEHTKMGKRSGNGQMAPNKLRQFLIGQILTAASLTNP